MLQNRNLRSSFKWHLIAREDRVEIWPGTFCTKELNGSKWHQGDYHKGHVFLDFVTFIKQHWNFVLCISIELAEAGYESWSWRKHRFLISYCWFVGPMDITIQAKCNPCLSNPCKNDGTCNNDPVDFYRCTCPYGFKVSRDHSGKTLLPMVFLLSMVYVLSLGACLTWTNINMGVSSLGSGLWCPHSCLYQ